MNPLLSVGELEARLPPNTLPLNNDGDLDEERILLALKAATGIIVAHLPWLLDDEGELVDPVPPRFQDALIGICADTALYQLTDRVSSHEDGRERYKDNMKLLEKIDKEFQGGLSGPDLQEASIVEASEDEDRRFFKKERLY